MIWWESNFYLDNAEDVNRHGTYRNTFDHKPFVMTRRPTCNTCSYSDIAFHCTVHVIYSKIWILSSVQALDMYNTVSFISAKILFIKPDCLALARICHLSIFKLTIKWKGSSERHVELYCLNKLNLYHFTRTALSMHHFDCTILSITVLS